MTKNEEHLINLKVVLLRPSMYVGEGQDASNSLAWFLNGYLVAIGGFSSKWFFQADLSKTLEENAKEFLKELEEKGIENY